MATNFTDTVRINVSDKCYYDVQRTNLLTDLLIKDRAKVLFVGEWDFTFTVAFAAYRRSHAFSITSSLGALLPAGAWEGITSTRYEPVGPVVKMQYVGKTLVQCKLAPTLSEVKCNIASIPQGFAQMNDNLFINYLPNVPAGTWQYGIDATALPTTLTQDQQVIWFQCPWIARGKCTPNFNTSTLISDFLLNMAAQIQPGVHVCVGIANHDDYMECYGLDKILIEATPVCEQYEIVGADDELTKKLLVFGYTHQSVDETKIPEKSHISLIFRKKALSNVQILNRVPLCNLDGYGFKVLFVGDRDFTFTLAFAAYRKSTRILKPWEGITSTRYEPAGPEGEFQYVGKKLVQCKPPLLPSDGKRIASLLGHNNLSGIAKFWQNVLESMHDNIFEYGIDPLALPPALVRDQHIIWFLCPWTSAEESSLLFAFLRDLPMKTTFGRVCISNSSIESVPCFFDFLVRIRKDNPIVSYLTEDHDKPYTCLGVETFLTQELKEYRNNKEPLFTLVFKVNYPN